MKTRSGRRKRWLIHAETLDGLKALGRSYSGIHTDEEGEWLTTGAAEKRFGIKRSRLYAYLTRRLGR